MTPQNLRYVPGWFLGLIPPAGWIAALVYGYLGYRRKTIQSLLAGVGTLLIIGVSELLSSPSGRTLSPGTIRSLQIAWLVSPLLILFICRKASWPTDPDHVAVPVSPMDPSDVRGHLRANRVVLIFSVAVLAVLLLLAWLEPFSTLIVTSFLLLGALPYGAVSLVRSIWYLPRSRGKSAYHFLIALVCLAGTVVFALNTSMSTTKARANTERVVASLERYRSEHGRYPDALISLVPRYLSEIPRCQIGRVHYFQPEDGSYNLACSAYVFMRWFYSSKTNGWELDD